MLGFRIKSTIIALGAFALVAPAALADETLGVDQSEVAITGGNLEFTGDPTVGNLASVTLSGINQTTTGTVTDFEATDARGSGAGWQINVDATQFTEWDTTNNVYDSTSPRTLPVSSLAMTQLSVTQDGTLSPSPTITGGPYVLDSGPAVKVASTALNAGMGKYDFTDTDSGVAGIALTLSLQPATTYAATYRSDLVLSIVTGP